MKSGVSPLTELRPCYPEQETLLKVTSQKSIVVFCVRMCDVQKPAPDGFRDVEQRSPHVAIPLGELGGKAG